jgi:hypothetical protein
MSGFIDKLVGQLLRSVEDRMLVELSEDVQWGPPNDMKELGGGVVASRVIEFALG